jgi:membrane protease YdiL (CAAX protease family)
MATVFAGFVLLWLLLDRSAALLGSVRGEYGILICIVVVVAAIAVEMSAFRRTFANAVRALGLGLPNGLGLAVALVLGGALVGFLALFAITSGSPIGLVDNWSWLALGMFAQGGVAEETVFRGFLFRHFREGRSFTRAVLLSAVPFVAVHLLLFLTLPFALALAAVLVSLSTSFPLAYLFEKSGNSIWPPAILHFAVQAPIKLVIAPEATFTTLAIIWLGLSVVVPWLVFAIRYRPG